MPVLNIGIIGLGEIAQVNHIACLSSLSDYYRITYLCDPSAEALAHCAPKVNGPLPQTTSSPEALCSSPTVDVVLICNASAFHPAHAILALQNDKYALVEKPLALTFRDIDAIIEAEKSSKGRVFVGYQRRYAEAFLDAVKEVGGMGKIQYARVRDIIGQNSTFVGQSGTFPKKFTDFKPEDTKTMTDMTDEMIRYSLNEWGVKINPDSERTLSVLGSLGSHDLSALRELLGPPLRVLGASLTWPIWTVLFQHENFPLTYESGINSVATFDAHIEVYSERKIVRVDYDTPYVKGLPVTMTVREMVEGGEVYQERRVRRTYEDPYTLEFLEFHRCAVGGLVPKTSAEDARGDLEVFRMIMQAG